MENLEEIKNFGPYMVNILNLIGIHSKEDLLAADYKKIKADLVKVGVTPHLNLFYSIEMGLQNRRWNEITAQEKQEIKEILNVEIK
ncbi:MAG: TfoX/Sxy family DNA transformation protein [Spirosomataceae bacterium]